MIILDKLFFEAGGYTADDLVKASKTERRQILQLGSAVIFSISASIISWGFASTQLINTDSSHLPVVVTALVVFLVSLSINRNLIFYSDMSGGKKLNYGSYTPPKSGATHMLTYLRIVLVLIVSILNFELVNTPIIVMLGLFELYPLLLKKQMGQTILGRRIQEKLIFQKNRSKLMGEEYARQIEESEREILTERSNDPAYDHLRAVK